jgi:sialic acid synthase SpsE
MPDLNIPMASPLKIYRKKVALPMIAEMSANHNIKIETAFRIIEEAKKQAQMLSKCKPTRQIR